jgi:hypothetical protein
MEMRLRPGEKHTGPLPQRERVFVRRSAEADTIALAAEKACLPHRSQAMASVGSRMSDRVSEPSRGMHRVRIYAQRRMALLLFSPVALVR